MRGGIADEELIYKLIWLRPRSAEKTASCLKTKVYYGLDKQVCLCSGFRRFVSLWSDVQRSVCVQGP